MSNSKNETIKNNEGWSSFILGGTVLALALSFHVTPVSALSIETSPIITSELISQPNNDIFEVITIEDIETLSQYEIDQKLKAAGMPVLGSEEDPLYFFTPKEILELTEADWDKIFQESSAGFQESLVFPLDKSYQFITDEDWKNLSQYEIDQKLEKADLPTLGEEGDPLYYMTPEEIENLTDAEWNDIMDQYDAFWEELDSGFEIFNVDYLETITEKDWETLSQAQIDQKLKAADYPTIGDPNHPLYNYTPAEIDNFTEEDWAEFEEKYENFMPIELMNFKEEDSELFDIYYLDIITEKDWATLSQAQIDQKLKAAGYPTIGDPEYPLYNYTPSEIDNFTEEDWDGFQEKYENFMPVELMDFEEDYFGTVESSYEGIISEEEWYTLSQAQIDKKLEAAGEAIIGSSDNPLYHYSLEQMDKFTDKEWDDVFEKLEEAFFNSPFFE